MAVYKHFCVYCDQLAPGDAKMCPFCGADDPFIVRCPSCRTPVEKAYAKCPSCGLDLKVKCPSCGKGFAAFIRQCPDCGASFLGKCVNPKCGHMQLYTITSCLKCKGRVER